MAIVMFIIVVLLVFGIGVFILFNTIIPSSTVMGIFNSTNPRKPSELCYPTLGYGENLWANTSSLYY
jgi:hypothetical protein